MKLFYQSMGVARRSATGPYAQALTGVFTSKRLMYCPPTGTLLADIRAAYGDHVYPGAT